LPAPDVSGVERRMSDRDAAFARRAAPRGLQHARRVRRQRCHERRCDAGGDEMSVPGPPPCDASAGAHLHSVTSGRQGRFIYAVIPRQVGAVCDGLSFAECYAWSVSPCRLAALALGRSVQPAPYAASKGRPGHRMMVGIDTTCARAAVPRGSSWHPRRVPIGPTLLACPQAQQPFRDRHRNHRGARATPLAHQS